MTKNLLKHKMSNVFWNCLVALAITVGVLLILFVITIGLGIIISLIKWLWVTI